jgi:hypothetical protein
MLLALTDRRAVEARPLNRVTELVRAALEAQARR